MNYKQIKQLFIDNFEYYSRNHIFEHDFYNLTSDDKYEIARDTFNDIAKDLQGAFSKVNFTEYKDNIIVVLMELLG